MGIYNYFSHQDYHFSPTSTLELIATAPKNHTYPFGISFIPSRRQYILSMTRTGQPVLRASVRIQKRTEARLAHKAASGKQCCSSDVEGVETNNSRATTPNSQSNPATTTAATVSRARHKSQAVKTLLGSAAGNKRKSIRELSPADSESSDSDELDDSDEFEDDSENDYEMPASRKRVRSVPKQSSTKTKAAGGLRVRTRTLPGDKEGTAGVTRRRLLATNSQRKPHRPEEAVPNSSGCVADVAAITRGILDFPKIDGPVC